MATETQPHVMDEIRSVLERIWFAGLGALSLAEEEGSRLFQQLTDAGERFAGELRRGVREGEEEGETLYRKLVDAGAELESRIRGKVDETIGETRRAVDKTRERIEEQVDEVEDQVRSVVEQALERIGVPTHAEMEALNQSIDRLARMVESLARAQRGEQSPYTMRSVGGGWFEILKGSDVVEKVQGREHAEARLSELGA